MRFLHLLNELKLHPPQIARAIKFLSRAKLIVLQPADTATGVLTDAMLSFMPNTSLAINLQSAERTQFMEQIKPGSTLPRGKIKRG